MTASPALPSQPHRPNDNVSRVSMLSDSIALIVNTRNYYPVALIPALVHHGFTSAERPVTEAMYFVQHLRPGLVVTVVDPERPDDLHILRLAARFGAYVLLLAPSPNGFALGLKAGADFCLSDSIAETALQAQVGAIRRRLDSASANRMAPSDLDLALGDFQLDVASRRLFYKGSVQVPLTAMEFSILAHLVENAGKTTSALELFHHVTGRIDRDAAASETVKVYIHRLRQKLHAYSGPPDLITTVRGYGYMIERRPSVA